MHGIKLKVIKMSSKKIDYKDVKNILCYAAKSYNLKNVTVMLSAGVDSIAALHFFIKNKERIANDLKISVDELNVKAFHFNHKLRHQNEIMEKQARKFCKDFNVPLVVKTNLTTFTTEAQAREVRFNALSQCVNNSFIVTAHHLNDCVESYILNVLRGHEGFVPIPFCTHLKNNVVLHPFLFTEKKCFLSYVEVNNLSQYVVEDESNTIIKGSRRNLIRNKIVPLLRDENIVLNKTIIRKMNNRLNTQ
jgi:tRNA(Ile)-lysidine synthase